MAETCREPKVRLRLFVDEEKNKVVLAEASKDFVDVLFSLLTLPMGAIVRLLEKHRESSKPITIGCFNNLYKSVVDMDIHNFETQASKEILLNPRSLSEVKCRKLKLDINPTDDLKFFTCRNLCNLCSNFNTSLCKCGNLMNAEMPLSSQPRVSASLQNDANGVFVSGRCSYIITDDLNVAVSSTSLVLNKLKSQGYVDVSKLGEKLVDVGFEEVLTLLECIFSSNAPLTDAFLNNKESTQDSSKIDQILSQCVEEKNGVEAEPEKVLTLSAVVRKHDMNILYVECGEDFVDHLFSFLAVPLESVLEIFGNISTNGCIGNLFGSFNDLSGVNERTTHKSMLHHYYRCKKQLLDITTDQTPVYDCYKIPGSGLTINSDLNPVVLMDPKSNGRDQSPEGSGFVKRDTKFTVSDDLIITPMNSSSTICLLKKFEIQAEDLEVQEISITKIEATSLLRASLVTSSALNTCLKNLIVKNSKVERLAETRNCNSA
ncbi:unnamed protein product [Arabis nemorensis]|uniref:DUF674 family protein n=1 Tax=Arabis nemorensis TaxID=586526 RepID=A0A565CGN2_9BRAS|nr:unnamed protein product [Arabis nemorensis]